MATTLINDLRNPGDPIYYSKGWIDTVEDHLPFFQDIGNGKQYTPTGMEKHRYNGRFYAFLRDVAKMTDPRYHYVYLRANNMTNPDQFGDNYPLLVFPDITKIEKVMSRYVNSIPRQA